MRDRIKEALAEHMKMPAEGQHQHALPKNRQERRKQAASDRLYRRKLAKNPNIIATIQTAPGQFQVFRKNKQPRPEEQHDREVQAAGDHPSGSTEPEEDAG